MRFDKDVQFLTAKNKVYNEETGNYDIVETLSKPIPCSISPTDVQTQILFYDGIREEALTIVFQVRQNLQDVEQIVFNKQRYNIKRAKYYRNKHTIFVVGV